MSKLDEIVAAIQAAQAELDSALSLCANASNEADEGQSIAGHVGSRSTIDGLAALKDHIEQFQLQITAARDTGDAVIGTADAVRTGGG